MKIFLKLLPVFFLLTLFTAPLTGAENPGKVTICHGTASETNPYERIVVSSNATGGHFNENGTPRSGHDHDLMFTGEVECPNPSATPTPTPSSTPSPSPSATIVPSATPTPSPSSLPTFPACPNTSGNVKVHYDYGTHAIVGYSEVMVGSDTVYNLESSNYLQCFCPVTGTNGIQTNWLNAGGFDESFISSLVSQGWTLISNGADWGLDPNEFLAKNSDYTCRASGGGTQEPSPTPTPSPTPAASITPTPTPSSTTSTSTTTSSSGGQGGPSSSSSTPAGEVLGATTLAPTGKLQQNLLNSSLMFGLIFLSLAALRYGVKKEN